VGLAALVVAVTAHRSHWISGYLEQEQARTPAAGTIGLGKDYVVNVWVPTRALREDLDPYDPDQTTVRSRYHTPTPSAPYTPSILLLLLPLSGLPLPQAAEAMTALNVLLAWLALLVLLPPRTPRACGLVALLGLAAFNGWAGESALLYGQPIGFFALGAALVSRAILQERFGAAAIAGLVLLLTKAQFALPVLIVLAVMRQWRAIGASVAFTAVLSLPFGVLFVRAAGGVADAIAVVARATSWTDSAFPLNRTDLLSLLTRNDAASLGTAGAVLQLVVLSALLAVVVRRSRLEGQAWSAAVAVALVALDLVAIYHQWYDLTILAVPAAVLLSRDESRGIWHELPLVSAVIAFSLVVNLATRGSVRAWVEELSTWGDELLTKFDLYWPPLISLALFAATLAALAGWGATTVRTPVASSRASEPTS